MEAAFLQALHADPIDEATWLALADWLDDDGQADRAELVRLVRRLRTLPVMEHSRSSPLRTSPSTTPTGVEP